MHHHSGFQIGERESGPIAAGRLARTFEHLAAQAFGFRTVFGNAVDQLPDPLLKVVMAGGNMQQAVKGIEQAIRPWQVAQCLPLHSSG